ncbi:hypothetical protein ACLOJK_011273 [Asimina triloba]
MDRSEGTRAFPLVWKDSCKEKLLWLPQFFFSRGSYKRMLSCPSTRDLLTIACGVIVLQVNAGWYMILAPFVAHSVYSNTTKGSETRDLFNFMIFPLLLSRWLHNQIWVSISRFQAARSKHRIVEKGIGFEQVDREENWDDQILLSGIFLYSFNWLNHQAKNLPIWRTDGVVIIALLHMLPVEFLYYWLHRALHHHYLYSRYHSHHHSSIVTEPITCADLSPPLSPYLYVHAFCLLPAATWLDVYASLNIHFHGLPGGLCMRTQLDYWLDLGPATLRMFIFTLFPPLKYLMYTPSKVMSAWRVSGIVHALEGWDAHECGDTLLNVEQVWQAALGHGFRPLPPRGTLTPLE